MNIAVGSAFRNSAHRLPFYFEQVLALQKHLDAANFLDPMKVRIIAVEGDSTDRTLQDLQHWAGVYRIETAIHKCDHGGPVFGSTEAPERMAKLSGVGNAILAGVRETDDALVYVESDLHWDPETISDLVELAVVRANGFDVFSPLIMAGKAFYDIWAFRKDGKRFNSLPPFWPNLKEYALLEMDSVGSCLVMRREVAKIRMTDGALVQWCENARAAGYKIAAVPSKEIHHP